MRGGIMFRFLLFLDSSICDDVNVLNIFYFVGQLIKLAFIIIPIGAILMLSFDLFKNVISNDEGSQNKNMAIFIRRVIVLIVVFLVPYIVSFFVNFIDDNLNLEKNGYLKCLNVTIDDIDKQLKENESNCKNSGGKWISSTRSCDGGDEKNNSSYKSSNNSSKKSTLKSGWTKAFGKTYYYKNGKKLKGKQKILGNYYYFSKKTGKMLTGWVTLNGDKYYFSKKDGKQKFGILKLKNDSGKYTDIWHLNSSSGKLEAVELGVPLIRQSGYNCGPTALNMIVSYHTGNLFDEQWFANKCGTRGSGFDSCSNEYGLKHKYIPYQSMTKEYVIKELFKGNPLIFSVDGLGSGSEMGKLATRLGYTAGGGHYLVISGYYNDSLIMKDPAGRKTASSWEEIHSVANGWSFFRRKK